MNELQRIQQEYKEQYERGEISYEEYEEACVDAYIDFNND